MQASIAASYNVRPAAVVILESSWDTGRRLAASLRIDFSGGVEEKTAPAISSTALNDVFAEKWDDAKAEYGVSGSASVESSLCMLVAHPDTPLADITDRTYGHAQFECLRTFVETGADSAKLAEYAWCVLPHCPSASSCVFPRWEKRHCESEVHNFLGFAYRTNTDPTKQGEYREKGYAHYHESLSLNNENCGT